MSVQCARAWFHEQAAGWESAASLRKSIDETLERGQWLTSLLFWLVPFNAHILDWLWLWISIIRLVNVMLCSVHYARALIRYLLQQFPRGEKFQFLKGKSCLLKNGNISKTSYTTFINLGQLAPSAFTRSHPPGVIKIFSVIYCVLWFVLGGGELISPHLRSRLSVNREAQLPTHVN